MPSSPAKGVYDITPVVALKLMVPAAEPVLAFTKLVFAPGKKSSLVNTFKVFVVPSVTVRISAAVVGTNGFGSVVSGLPSLSSSGSPASQSPSPSVSRPSLAMSKLAPAVKSLLAVAEQSSQPSPSKSWQLEGSKGALSAPSKTPSLSSSVSEMSGVPSPSVSILSIVIENKYAIDIQPVEEFITEIVPK